jgi:hypothetical protein
MKNYVNQVVPPALPLARDEYERAYQDQLNNVLRLYFVQLNAIVNTLHIPTTYTVADLPSAAGLGVGARSFATDATGPTFGSIVVGGGSTKVPVYSDGTNWRVG